MEGVGERKQGNLELRQADSASLDLVGEITRRTIRTVYPHYYPQGVVDFFLRWHEDRRILPDVLAGEVYLLFDGGTAVGTVTLHGMEITRLYVPPEYQGKGYGRVLLDFAERAIGGIWGKIRVEASLPAGALYWKRGYRVTDFQTERQENGDVLCWNIMEREWSPRTKPQGSMTFRIWGD